MAYASSCHRYRRSTPFLLPPSTFSLRTAMSVSAKARLRNFPPIFAKDLQGTRTLKELVKSERRTQTLTLDTSHTDKTRIFTAAGLVVKGLQWAQICAHLRCCCA